MLQDWFIIIIVIIFFSSTSSSSSSSFSSSSSLSTSSSYPFFETSSFDKIHWPLTTVLCQLSHSLSFFSLILVRLLRASSKAAQYGQSDIAIGICRIVSVAIGIRHVCRLVATCPSAAYSDSSSHASTATAGADGLSHRDGYGGVLIVALHHLNGACIANSRGIQLPPALCLV